MILLILVRMSKILLKDVLMIILAIILGVGFFVFYFLLFTRKFSRHIQNISVGIQEISSGNLKHRIPIDSVNELGHISLGLNKMAFKLEQIIKENEKNEKEYRDF